MLENLKSWWSRPFNSNMGASHWFMFVGLLMVTIMIWTMVMATLRDAAD